MLNDFAGFILLLYRNIDSSFLTIKNKMLFYSNLILRVQLYIFIKTHLMVLIERESIHISLLISFVLAKHLLAFFYFLFFLCCSQAAKCNVLVSSSMDPSHMLGLDVSTGRVKRKQISQSVFQTQLH